MLTRDSSANQVYHHAAIVDRVLDLFNECCGAFSQLDFWQYAEKKSDAAHYGYPGDYLVDATVEELREHLDVGATDELSDIRDKYGARFCWQYAKSMKMPTVVSDLLDSIDSLASAHEDHDQDIDLSDYVQGLRNLESMGRHCDIWQELRDLADEITAYADAMEESEEATNTAVATFAGAFDHLAQWLIAELGYRRQPEIMTAVADRRADWCDIGSGI